MVMPTQPRASTDRKPRTPTRAGRLFLRAFIGIPLWIFAGAIVFGLVPRLVAYSDAASWPTIEGRVVESTVTRGGSSKRGRTRYPRIAYSYTVDGREHTGDTYQLVRSGDNSGGSERIVSRHPVGSTIPVHVDPSDPTRSIVKPGVGAGWVFVVIAALAAGGAMYCTASFLWIWFEPRGKGASGTGRLREAHQGVLSVPADRDPRGT